MLEEARALGELRKQGWSPKRTIIYCAWDGEEPALLGSTEWAETHAAELQQHAVAYVNSDGNGRGFLQAEGSHALEHFINDVARDITDPETHLTRLEAPAGPRDRARRSPRTRRRSAAAPTGASARSDRDRTSRRSSSTSASPTLNIGYGGEDENGIYHSIYDDFYFYTHFLDTDFAYGRTLAQTGGTAIIRLADADILPFQYANLADTVRTYDEELQLLREEEARGDSPSATARSPTACSRPSTIRGGRAWRRRSRPCRRRIDFTPISRAIEALARRAVVFDEARAAAAKKHRVRRGARGHRREDRAVRAAAARRRRPRRTATGSSTCCTRPASTRATA